ncbi:MAG: alanine-tRNA synthetase second additional domain-containing protein [Defluviitaleaceae bacterium]|nr:alanine-tRNA synthetase second additional domain-containing protein [Defluviitaleaceae bacterium]
MTINPLQKNHLYSLYFAPRGDQRMVQLGMQLSHLHLSPLDQLIGVMGEPASGKSLLIKGMFPGLELTNDDAGVNIRPLPILDLLDEEESSSFYSNHTYHLDVRFESAFTQLGTMAEAVKAAIKQGKRVVVEHFELLYPLLDKRNAELLIGVGSEIVITRTSIFGPAPEDIAKISFDTIKYRKMAHTAEDLIQHLLSEMTEERYEHGDVRNGFVLRFKNDPKIDLAELTGRMEELISQKIPVSFIDEKHIKIEDIMHYCTRPRFHVNNTGDIEGFKLLNRMIFDHHDNSHLIVGLVGNKTQITDEDLNRFAF